MSDELAKQLNELKANFTNVNAELVSAKQMLNEQLGVNLKLRTNLNLLTQMYQDVQNQLAEFKKPKAEEYLPEDKVSCL